VDGGAAGGGAAGGGGNAAAAGGAAGGGEGDSIAGGSATAEDRHAAVGDGAAGEAGVARDGGGAAGGDSAGEGGPAPGGVADGGGGGLAGGVVPAAARGGSAEGPGSAAAAGGATGRCLPSAPTDAARSDDPRAWTLWSRNAGLPHLPRGLHVDSLPSTSPHDTLAALHSALAADRVYDSVDELTRALQAQQATFAPWLQRDPAFKPIVSGFVQTSAGLRRVLIMLDTGATHCFICAPLARQLALPASSTPGPSAVSMASPGTPLPLPPPVHVHLVIGDSEPLREVIDMSPLDLGPGLDIILG